jgi:hypothetical protein
MFNPALASCLSPSHRRFERLGSDADSDISDDSTRTLIAVPPAVSLLRRFSDAVGEIFHPRGSRCTGQRASVYADADVFTLPERRDEANPPGEPTLEETTDLPLPAMANRRPAALAFQWFHELMDNIRRIEERPPHGPDPVASLADALTLRLFRAGLVLPAPRHAIGTSTRVLLGPDWAEAVVAGRLNLADLLAVLRRSGQVDARSKTELRRRLADCFELVIHRLAETHVGVQRLRHEGEPALRPVLPAMWVGDAPDLRATQRRMQVFNKRAERMLATSNAHEVSTGALAQGWVHCLRPQRHHPDGAEAALAGQVLPAVMALVAARNIEPGFAARLQEAAARVDCYLAVRGALDMPKTETCVIREEIDPMTHAQARDRLFGPLMHAALDPEELDARLQEPDIGALLGFMVPAMATDEASGATILNLLRLTLRPMVDSGLVTEAQRRRITQRLDTALRLREPRTVRSETV